MCDIECVGQLPHCKKLNTNCLLGAKHGEEEIYIFNSAPMKNKTKKNNEYLLVASKTIDHESVSEAKPGPRHAHERNKFY